MKTMTGVLLTSLIAFSAETINPKSTAKTDTSTQTPFPICVDSTVEVQKIISIAKNNKDTKYKYDGYRKALSSDSDQELIARLIYAETIAANCAEQNSNILPLIAGAINNRIRKRNGDVKSVVYERNQFASSLNHYSSSKYQDFLCPRDSKIWKLSMLWAAKLNKDISPLAVNYYLYKHHPGWNKEPWSLPETELSLKSKVRDCIRVFENKSWK